MHIEKMTGKIACKWRLYGGVAGSTSYIRKKNNSRGKFSNLQASGNHPITLIIFLLLISNLLSVVSI